MVGYNYVLCVALEGEEQDFASSMSFPAHLCPEGQMGLYVGGRIQKFTLIISFSLRMETNYMKQFPSK